MDSNKNGLLGILIIAVVWLLIANHSLRVHQEELKDSLYQYDASLREANSQIEDENASVQEAKGYIGGNYEEMEYALDNLREAEGVMLPAFPDFLYDN